MSKDYLRGLKMKTMTPDLIVVHCSATPPDVDVGANEIDKWHRKQGWWCIGYHYVIRRDGTIEAGRPDNVHGAHAHGHNHHSIGVCLVGGVERIPDRDGKDDVDGPKWDMIPTDNFTPEQYESLYGLLSSLLINKQSIIDICGHRDLPQVKKDCPCFSVDDWITQKHGNLNDILEANFQKRKGE